MEYEKTLKAAILGTEDYHVTMREITDSSLHRIVNYVPQRMKPDNPVLSVHPDYLERVNEMMTGFSSYTRITNSNPRSPYLVLAWLLVGSDNEHRICQYVDEVRTLKQVAIILIRIALGDTPLFQEINTVAETARTTEPESWLARNANFTVWFALVIVAETRGATLVAALVKSATEVAKDAANKDKLVAQATRSAISTKAHQWAHIRDEEALQIIRQLTLDVLSL